MLTLITGTPGAGKTLLAVATILPHYLQQTVVVDEDGNATPVKRRILVDGIKDLIIEHELMAPTKIVSKIVDRTPVETLECEGQGVANWWEWCKPGDVIVIDEVQRMWRPRGNGSKVPQMIAELETHRHRGVDFVLITQHPMLLDQNVRRLVSRHIHVRRMWGGSRAVRYEWDHCSSPDRVSDAGKSYWPYPKDAFKYYKSAEVHTKQGGKVPAALLILGLALVVLPVIAYYSITGVNRMLHPVASAALPATASVPSKTSVTYTLHSVNGVEVGGPIGGVAPIETATGANRSESRSSIQGCIATPTRCACFDVGGGVVKSVTDEQCREGSYTIGQLVPLRQVAYAQVPTSSLAPAAAFSPTIDKPEVGVSGASPLMGDARALVHKTSKR